MKNTRGWLLLIVVLVGISATASALETTPARDDLYEGFSGFVKGNMAKWKVPGLTVTVVKEGKVIFVKGFGYRDLEKKLRVTPDTLFPICSCTKAFTTMAAGLLADQGKVELDSPVIKYLPDFKLYDDYATQKTTIRDLLCHRTGLPAHNDVWKDKKISREELYKIVGHLKPSCGFREKFQYNNIMYSVAGYLVGKVSSGSWEEFVKKEIFKPLAMNRSVFSYSEAVKSGNFSEPYVFGKEGFTRVAFRDLSAVGPAASIHSTAEEMSRWLLLHLSGGKIGEKRFISENMLSQMHSPQMVIHETLPVFKLPISVYGLGWEMDPYRCFHMIWHPGGIKGYSSAVSFLPKEHIGVVVLSNSDNNPAPFYITTAIFDHFTDLKIKESKK
ncbi:MAG: beta-lactamase family protein [bacterium]|nr:beta-lactamase family protein [bacterium]